MADLDKLYDKADKFLQRQKFESAIETYEEILQHDPNDEEALINLGDLNIKLNRTAEALRYQLQLADYYINRVEFSKAIVICKKVLKLSPQDAATWTKLASLLEKSQKNTEALQAYREAVVHFRRASMYAPMLECLTHIAKLDPNDIEEQLELGELASRARQNGLAMSALLRAAQLARQAGGESRWEKLVEQAHRLDPTDEIAFVPTTKLYLKRGNYAEATKLIEPLLAKNPDDMEVLELACNSYLGLGNCTQAQPLCWKFYRAKPERVDIILKLLDGWIQKGAIQQVLGTLNELKDRLFQQGKRNEFLKMLEKTYEADESNIEVLEVLSNLYSEMNKEDGLRRSFSRLFNLYLASEKYDKAADTLERILDTDPYGEGHSDRLVNLEGHIDAIWYRNILARLQPPSISRTSPATRAVAAARARIETLEDLLVEGEMYHQYELSAKLLETAEKIDRLFPGADEKNPRVRELYENAGYTPKSQAPVAAAVAPLPWDDAALRGVVPFQPVDDLRKISEITSNIHRESTPQGVLQVAVNEIGRALNASRCWGAVGVPDGPPVLTAEYCSPLVFPSDPVAALELFTFLMEKATSNPDGWSVENAARSPLLSGVAAEIQQLGIRSLQVLPLIDKDAAVGLLLLEQCEAPRSWSPGESVLLRAIATQVIIAVNNTKLRRLVHSLAGADPETGLLPRSAYLECLLSEARRSKDQSQPLSVCLLEPENPHALMKRLGDAGVQRFVSQVGKALAPALRPNDISIRYSPLSIVLVFPSTALPQAELAVEKVRHALAQVRVNSTEAASFCAALCDVPLRHDFDVVDGVTEVINRLEVSLDRAHKEGGEHVLISQFAG